MSQSAPSRPYAANRHDGWTQARQAHFLDCLEEGGSVAAACAAVGKSGASAYRLRRRADAAAFAAAWDACLLPHFAFRQRPRRSGPPNGVKGAKGGEGVEGVEGEDFAPRPQFHQPRPPAYDFDAFVRAADRYRPARRPPRVNCSPSS